MGKNYVEDSLKRFLKRKVKITLGFVVAFLITGTIGFGATEEPQDLSKLPDKIDTTYTGGNYFISEENGSVTITNTNKSGAVFDLAVITLDDNQTLELISDNFGKGVIKNTQVSGLNGEKKGTLNLTNKNTMLGEGLSAGIGEQINISVDKLNINGFYGIKQSGGTANLSANNLIITTKNNGVNLIGGDFNITNSKNVTITSTNYNGFYQVNGNTNISADNLNISGGGAGVSLLDGNFTVNSNNLTITSENEHGFLQAGGSSRISADKLTITSKDKGINISNGTFIIENANEINIASKDESGIYQTSGTFTIENSKDVVIIGEKKCGIKQVGGAFNISTESLKILGSSVGVYADSGKVELTASEKITIANGTINENGEFIKGEYDAIVLETNADFSLNKDSDNTIVEIIGNITAYSENGFNLDLTNEDSFIDGKILTGSGEKVTSNIGLSNGATWNNTGDSNVTNVTLNGGVITNSSTKNDITIDSLGGNSGTLNIGTEIDENGKATVGKIEIGKVDDNLNLDINYSNVGTDTELSKDEAKELLEDLLGDKEHIVVKDGNLNGTASLEEGFITEGYEAEFSVDKNGGGIKDIATTGKNSMVEGISDLATINLLTWRQEMNSLNKRMGELRNSTGEHGVWTRVYTGKIENGERYDNDYQTYQVGYDKKYSVDNGVMFIGGLVSYSKGETNYELGTGENYSVGAGIYATWLNNDGYFADVVLKQSRLHNKFDVTSKDLSKSQSGDYNNWGTSISGQYGKRFDVNDKLFIEPSAELTLGRVEDTTYTTSAGVNVHQDTMYSLVGNIGTAVGYKINDKGNIYTRVSLVREFQGDIDTYYEHNSATNETHEDLSDTWVEFGIGANYRFAEDLNVYVDLQKTGEATVDTEWQANLGFRYEF